MNHLHMEDIIQPQPPTDSVACLSLRFRKIELILLSRLGVDRGYWIGGPSTMAITELLIFVHLECCVGLSPLLVVFG